MIVTPKNTAMDELVEPCNEKALHLQKLLSQHLVNFDLNIRTLCSLERSGIRTLGDLLSHSRDEVKKMHRLGAVSVAEIDAMLERYKLNYGMK
jgi:DNA-directed RNA polymerase subunit alpha